MSLILLSIISIGDAAAPTSESSESLGNLLNREALRIFELADKNKDQVLDAAEQADAEKRTKKAFSRYVGEHTLAGPRVPAKVEEPLVADLNRMTSDEFVQQFLSQAAIHDAETRARRIAKGHQPVKNHGGIVVASSTKQTDKEKNFRDDLKDNSKDDSKAPIPAQKTQMQGQSQQTASATGQNAFGGKPIYSGQMHQWGFVNHPSQQFGQQFGPGFNTVGPFTSGVGGFSPDRHSEKQERHRENFGSGMNSGGGFGGNGFSGGGAASQHSDKHDKHDKHHGK